MRDGSSPRAMPSTRSPVDVLGASSDPDVPALGFRYDDGA